MIIVILASKSSFKIFFITLMNLKMNTVKYDHIYYLFTSPTPAPPNFTFV